MTREEEEAEAAAAAKGGHDGAGVEDERKEDDATGEEEDEEQQRVHTGKRRARAGLAAAAVVTAAAVGLFKRRAASSSSSSSLSSSSSPPPAAVDEAAAAEAVAEEERGPEEGLGVVLCPGMEAPPPPPGALPALQQQQQQQQQQQKPAPSPWLPWRVASQIGRMLGIAGAPQQQQQNRPPAATQTPAAAAAAAAAASGPGDAAWWGSPRRVVVVGLHGWALFRGAFSAHPIQVSSKFCGMAADAVRGHVAGLLGGGPGALDGVPLEVVEVPLASHACVEARVSQYESALLGRRDELEGADVVVFASHSQGAMVAGLLLRRVADAGAVAPGRQRVLLLAMAGIHHGPFPDLLSDYQPSTAELFEFGKAYSPVAQRYGESVASLMREGVRVCCVASWMDQVVPLYSALFLACREGGRGDDHHHHQGRRRPRLMRAVYVGREQFCSDFLTGLVRLSLHARNTGRFSDVLVHLSGFLRGRLLARSGAHSTLHSEPRVYRAAVGWALSDPEGPPPAEAFVDPGSSAVWAESFRESFTLHGLNLHLLRVRTAELLAAAREPGSGLEDEAAALADAYWEWQPTASRAYMTRLKECLAPVFARGDGGGGGGGGGKEEHEGGNGGEDDDDDGARSRL